MQGLKGLMLLYLFLSFKGYAATIKGRIVDVNEEAAVGAIITLEEFTGIHDVAGLDGTFRLTNVPLGTHVVKITYVGMKSFKQTISVSNDSQTITLNAKLEYNTATIEDVTIVGIKDESSDYTARKLERSSDKIINIISGKTIQLSPDITVANVVQRVSGVSIERNNNGDGQYAIIRGMDKRYNYTLVNGVKIPSPDNKYRYVPLDIFPAELLERLEVYKSLTPNMEGDAIGGAVNMVMRDAPGKFYVSANIATGYSEMFFDRAFESYDQSFINTLSPYEQHGKTYRATVNDFPTELVDYKSSAPPPNIIGGLAIGNRFFNKRLGVIVAGSYQNTYRGSNSLFFESDNVDTNKVVVIKEMNTRYYSEQQRRLGVHAKIDYRFKSPRHHLQWYNAAMDLQNIQVRNTTNVNYSAGYDKTTGDASMAFDMRSRMIRQKIYNSTLQGEHHLFSNLTARWSAVYSLATSQTPDNTKLSFYGKREDGIDSMLFVDQMSRRWEHNSDQDLSGYASLTYQHQAGKSKLEWEVGSMYRQKTRKNFYNNYTLKTNVAHQHDVWQKDFTSFTQIQWMVQNPQGSVGQALTYNASENITAGYAMMKWNVWRFIFVAGARLEHTNQGYELLYPAGEQYPIGEQIYTDILPSAQLKYQIMNNHYLKATYYKAINRPGFFEVVPYRVTNEEYAERGNPNLKRAIADNIDLRYECFPNPNDQLMLGVFYKKIKDPIEYTLQPDALRGQNVYYTPGNFGTAVNYGAEFDMIKYFKNFGYKVNYTYTNSTITTTKSKRIRNDQGNLELVSIEQTRPLYGQSNHIANAAFLYKNMKRGIDAQLAFNYTGERINTVAQFVESDLWQKAFIQMDASAEKTLKGGVTIFAKVNNILNTPLEVYVKGKNPQNNYKPEQEGDNTLIRRDYYQRSYIIGVRWKLQTT
jgi:hypothetical protein